MDWLVQFMGALTGTGVAVAAAGYLARSFLDSRLEKDLEEHKALLREEEAQRAAERLERADIRAIVRKYSRVILLAASDLQDRLWHLTERQAKSKNKVLLAGDHDKPIYGAWPMTPRHYLTSSMYLFCSYFFWVETLKNDIRFLEFSEAEKSNAFNYHVKRIERMFAETELQRFAAGRISTDYPVFQLMQAEAGDALTLRSGDQHRAMTFHEFRRSYDDLLARNEGLGRLQVLLLGAMSDAPSNFCLRRLKLVCNALHDLVVFLHDHNGLTPPEDIERVPLAAFDEAAYDNAWPSDPPTSAGTA